MSMILDFAHSVLLAAGPGTTHLKLQKLLFYAYGAARSCNQLALHIPFQNWKHGPVCVAVYEHFSEFGSMELTPNPFVPQLHGAALDAVRVYKRLSAWQLRNESHLEAPWIDSHPGATILDDAIVSHFRRKFAFGHVEAPKNLPGVWSLAVDGLPSVSASSLGALADALEENPFQGMEVQSV